MKKSFLSGVFLLTLTVLGAAQQTNPVGEGYGSWYDEGSGFFASHANLPFGTELVVTNINNGKQVTVQVGGRIPQDQRWILDISPAAADAIEMNDMGFTRVRVDQVVKAPVAAKALRTTSVRDFHQNGRAVILSSGVDLTAGHPSLSMGRQVQITNRANGQKVVATVKNRVRASRDRIVEISRATAQVLGARGTYIDVQVDSIDK
ncbi:MAG: septal ring lytic transglycosylase RlpA family protein [Treponema sp.]|jgi:rare lipoprotein A (peptidoglycan hydrolase)|nr:septal ring lytic transglycosylase RlpA family protein [Treponema sp.]